jgi:hypothetical protein
VSIIEMSHDGSDTFGILQGGSVEQRANVGGVKGFDDLRDERFLGGLVELEGVMALAPDILGGLDLRAGGCTGNPGVTYGVALGSTLYFRAERSMPRWP